MELFKKSQIGNCIADLHEIWHCHCEFQWIFVLDHIILPHASILMAQAALSSDVQNTGCTGLTNTCPP
jgi:hypothetical protein